MLEHCLGADRKCTCLCGKGLRPEFSLLRQERGRICQDCDVAEQQEKQQAEMDACVCMWNDFSGRSVCGLPCPTHNEIHKT